MQDTTTALARQIKAEAVRRGMKLEDIAAEVGLSGPQLSHRLSGRTDFRLREMLAIARVLDVPLSDLTRDAA